MATGAYVYRDSYYAQRLILTASRSGTKVSYTLKLQSTGSMYATSPYSISGAVSKSGNFTASSGAGFTITIASGSFTRSTAGTISASATMFWGGRPTVSVSFGAAGSKPSAPTNFSITRVSDKVVKLIWEVGSGHDVTRVRRSLNGGAYTTLQDMGKNVTTRDVNMVNDSYYRFNIRSVNAIGSSDHIYLPTDFYVYSTPNIPEAPEIKANKAVHWVSSARYPHGFEIERTDGSNSVKTTVTGRSTRSWTDPTAQKPTTKYRIRAYAGDVNDYRRAWSAWSAWSDTVMGSYYGPPRITKIEAARVDSANKFNEMGTYVRVTHSGTVTKVPDGSTETNTLARKIQWRKKGTTSWSTQTISGTAPNNWTNVGTKTTSGSFAQADAYEVRLAVKDKYSNEVYAYTEVPVSQVALSMDSKGIGAGKVIERGVLDVGGDAYVEGVLDVGGHANFEGAIRNTQVPKNSFVKSLKYKIPVATSGPVTEVTVPLPSNTVNTHVPILTLSGVRGTVDRFVPSVLSHSATNMVIMLKNLTDVNVAKNKMTLNVFMAPLQ